MKNFLLCCLILLGGCALRTVEKSDLETTTSPAIEQPVEKVVQKKTTINQTKTAKKVVKSTKKQPSKKHIVAKPKTKMKTSIVPTKEPLKCENIVGVRLYQIFKTFAMGKTCVADRKNFSCNSGQTVYVPAIQGKPYQYDDMILPKSGECFAYNGTFHYHSKRGIERTAPCVTLIAKPQQVQEPQAETPKAEEAKAEAKPAETPKAEETKAEVKPAETPKAEETKTEAPKAEAQK